MTRHPTWLSAAAALIASAAFGAQANEAGAWDPHMSGDRSAATATDAMPVPGAWTLQRGDATEFRDAVARDTMRSRSSVRADLAQARSRGWLPDTGEAGATDRVWARRVAYVVSWRDAALERDTALQTGPDPIGALATLTGAA